MTDIIEANFSQIKEILQQHKDEVIKAINLEKNKEIVELKNIISAKENFIHNLKQKEGELKGKDETIANLNRSIDSLQKQLEVLA